MLPEDEPWLHFTSSAYISSSGFDKNLDWSDNNKALDNWYPSVFCALDSTNIFPWKAETESSWRADFTNCELLVFSSLWLISHFISWKHFWLKCWILFKDTKACSPFKSAIISSRHELTLWEKLNFSNWEFYSNLDLIKL